jgi:hypothetical protein
LRHAAGLLPDRAVQIHVRQVGPEFVARDEGVNVGLQCLPYRVHCGAVRVPAQPERGHRLKAHPDLMDVGQLIRGRFSHVNASVRHPDQQSSVDQLLE